MYKPKQKLYFVDIRTQELDVITIISSDDENTVYKLGKDEVAKSSTKNIEKYFVDNPHTANAIAVQSCERKIRTNERSIESLQRKNDLLQAQIDVINLITNT